MKIPMKKTEDEMTPDGRRMEFSVSANDLLQRWIRTWALRIGAVALFAVVIVILARS